MASVKDMSLFKSRHTDYTQRVCRAYKKSQHTKQKRKYQDALVKDESCSQRILAIYTPTVIMCRGVSVHT
jgi:hypothetical protein